jgi:hypothetical protein
MSFSKTDELAINTIRLLAVSNPETFVDFTPLPDQGSFNRP